jgi:hypothetical protein
MSETPINSPMNTDEDAAASPPGPTGPVPDPEPAQPQYIFLESYEYAKLNINWPRVLDALRNNPDWLKRIPEGKEQQGAETRTERSPRSPMDDATSDRFLWSCQAFG